MREVYQILKLQFKRRSIRWPDIKGKKLVGILLAVLLLVGVFASFFMLMLKVSLPFYKLDLEKTYLVFVMALLLIISVIYQTVEILKQFYFDQDHDLYAKLPVEDWKVKMAKSLYLISKQFLLVVIYFGFFVFPFAVVSGYTMGFYIRLLFTALIFIPLPFLGAVLISIPAFFLVNIFRRYIVAALSAIVVILGSFYFLYTQFISVVMNLINNSGGFINPEQLERIKNTTNIFFISNLFYKIINQTHVGWFILSILIAVIILSLVAVLSYYLLVNLSPRLVVRRGGMTKVYTKKEFKQHHPVISILKKEIKTIFRNSDYSFQVIVINALMPLFMIMTVRVTAQLGAEAVGILIVPGVALLTTLIFILLSSNFQSNLISSEKSAYYIGLILPIKYRYYLYIRIILPIFLNTLMMMIGLFVLMMTNYLTVGQFFLILGISFFFLLGYSIICIYKDYKNPEYQSGVGGSINFLTNTATGLILATVLGLMLSILPFFNEKRPGGYYFPIEATYSILMLITIIYFASSAFVFLRQLRRDNVWKNY